jgi:pimeloyl-ACP methyl ester carboxylesterase
MGAMRLSSGVRLETAWWGQPGAPALVLLHEGLGSIALWRDTPQRLAAGGWPVFAWSRAGYGHSDACALPRPLSYLHDEARLVLPEVLAAAGIGRHVLVGHSDGASIAAIHAGSTPHPGLAGIVAMTPHYFVETMCLDALRQARIAYAEGDLRARLARYHDHVDAAFHGWNDIWLDPAFAASFDLADCLARIRVPLLQIHGKNDPYGTTAQTGYAEAHVTAPVRTLIVPARHAPHQEAAQIVVPEILGFARACFGEAACPAA